MSILDRKMSWRQCGAAIDMSGDSLRDYALFRLDLYLTGAEEGFAPPAPLISQSLGGPGRYTTGNHSRAGVGHYGYLRPHSISSQ
jgi:hypothetical protein